ncbi:MAG: sulfatase-like hydrolase/transferase [Planctomycetota bacterium]
MNDSKQSPTRRPSHLACSSASLALALLGLASSTDASQALPNIIIVYADDLGYGDLSCYNPSAAYTTPRLDRMAAEGIRFTDAHSPSTICSPSRYGLYSGQQVGRTGRRSVAFEGPGGPSYINDADLTIAELVQRKGYRTAVFGKWHLGLSWYDKAGKRLNGGFETSLLIDYERSTPLVDGPNAMGFDESFITPNCPTTDPLYVYIENGLVPVPASERHLRDSLPNPGGKWRWDNDEGWKSPGYRFVDADVLFCDKALDFMQRHRAAHADRPFFLVLATQIAHAPVLPAPGFEGQTEAGARGDFVRELDTLTGRILDQVAALGIDEDTLVLFNSDNGPETLHTVWMRQDHEHDAAGGLRGMKRDGWEGGHHVPFIARWPGHIPAGQVSAQLTNTTDIFATVASLIGEALPDDVAVDSFDMAPVLLGLQPPEVPVRPHLLTQSFRGEYQLRCGAWKYLDHTGSGGNDYTQGALAQYALPELAPEATGQLYDLATDPRETHNLYFLEPERRDAMKALLAELTLGVGARSAPRDRRPIARHANGAGVWDFAQRPAEGVVLVGDTGHCMLPESDGPSQWTFNDGVLTASPGWDSVVTPAPYQDFRMHLEFNVNAAANEDREANGNSGVYIQQRYELQILDSFGVTSARYEAWDCGSLYRLKKPDRLACKPAGEWQSFDIVFRAARFDGAQKLEPARITVLQNQTLIHDNVELPRKTGAGQPEGPDARPIKLQGHHNQVRFRNVWIQPLALDAMPELPANDARRRPAPNEE